MAVLNGVSRVLGRVWEPKGTSLENVSTISKASACQRA